MSPLAILDAVAAALLIVALIVALAIVAVAHRHSRPRHSDDPECRGCRFLDRLLRGY